MSGCVEREECGGRDLDPRYKLGKLMSYQLDYHRAKGTNAEGFEKVAEGARGTQRVRGRGTFPRGAPPEERALRAAYFSR